MTATSVPGNAGVDRESPPMSLPVAGDAPAPAAPPAALECDLITVPIDACCGVFDELARMGGPVPPIAQIAENMVFVVRFGSVAEFQGSSPFRSNSPAPDLPELSGVILQSATPTMPDVTCWIVPPVSGEILPHASAVIAALHAASARREHTR